MRRDWIAFTALVAGAAACTPPEITFEKRESKMGGGTLKSVELDGDRITVIGPTGTSTPPTGTLTAAGVDALNRAIDDLRDGWDGPYPYECEITCPSQDIYSLGDNLRASHPLAAPPDEFAALYTWAEDIYYGVGHCQYTDYAVRTRPPGDECP